MVAWLSLIIPFAYLSTLIGSLATFSHLYRTRKAAKARSLEPWFPPHLQRNIYLSLLELQSSPDTKVPDSLLKAALLRRATEDIHRLVALRNAKPAISTLLQRGQVGDELFQRFQIAENEIQLELRDVANEANALAPQQNWGQIIFQSAGEMAQKDLLEKQLADLEAKRAPAVEAWARRKEEISSGFMKELEAGTPTAATPAKKAAGSDDDAVLVESGGPAVQPSTPTTGGKKKKGKH